MARGSKRKTELVHFLPALCCDRPLCPHSCLYKNPESFQSHTMTTGTLWKTSLSLVMWVSGEKKNRDIIDCPGSTLLYLFLTLVYFRVWDAGSILMVAVSTFLTSVCTLTEPPKSQKATCRSTRLSILLSPAPLMFLTAPSGSPATMSRGLHRPLWHNQEKAWCGLDKMTASTFQWW